MDTWELIAREQVRNSIAAYTHAGDRGRLPELAAVFTEDGVLEVKGREPARGREAIVQSLSAAVERGRRPAGNGKPGFVRHFVANVHFESVSPTEIRTAAYFLVVTGNGPDHWGRYRDVHVRVGDIWQIAHRYVRVDAAAPNSSASVPS